MDNNFEQFQTIESTKKFLKGIPDDCRDNILNVLSDQNNKNEQSESIEEISELESENYKIDTHLSVKEKLNNGRIKKKDSNGIVFIRKDLGEGAYVIEYLEGVDEKYIGEQKFSFFAVSKLLLRSKCIRNKEDFGNILGNLSKDTLKKQHKLSGRYKPEENTIEDAGLWNNYRIEDGTVVGISENFEIFYSDTDPDIAHSIRLVKGR